MIRLSTRQKGRKITYTVSFSFRLFCATVLCFLSWGIILYLSEGESLSSMILPLVLWVLSLLGLLYREAWVFDSEERSVTSVFGFGPFVRRARYGYDEIACIELTHFVRGTMDGKAEPNRKQRKRAMVVFSLVLTGGEERRTIEVIAERVSEGRTERAAEVISAVSGIGLSMDRARDLDIDVTIRGL